MNIDECSFLFWDGARHGRGPTNLRQRFQRISAATGDRLSRALKDVLHIMERIAQAGAGFRSITENIDTTTPAGRMMMQMIGSFAELERATIRE